MSKLQENSAKAEAYLARFKEKGVLNRIGGEDAPAGDGATFETISPVDLKPLAKVAQGKAADIDRAAKAAKAAFADWAAMPGDARKDLLLGLPDRGPRSRAHQMGPERPATPDAVGVAGTKILIRARQPVCRHRGHGFAPEGATDHRPLTGIANRRPSAEKNQCR